MRKHWVFGSLFLLIVLIGAGLRVVKLDQRPLHNDEANQAVKFGHLLEAAEYVYDPVDHHGPSLYFLTLPVAWVTAGRNFAGTNEYTIRLVPVFFGIGLILLLLLLYDAVPPPVLILAGTLTAISPAMVYFSRFYIQEMLLVFFSFGSIACAWRYLKAPSYLWAVLVGVMLGMMHATKETCVIAFAAMGTGLGGMLLWEYGLQNGIKTVMKHFNCRHLAAMVSAAVVCSLLFFSSFFTNPQGPIDSITTYANYLTKAGDEGGHTHSFFYYLQLLAYVKAPRQIWSEALILLLAVVGLGAMCCSREMNDSARRFVRVVGIYALFLVLVYSTLSYKTPWCMLTFLQGLILLAGVGGWWLYALCRKLPIKIVAILLFLAAAAQLTAQSRRLNHDRRYATSQETPWTYVQTSMDFLRLAQRISDLVAVSPDKEHTPIFVVAAPDKTWPLPWYLRGHKVVGYWQHPSQVETLTQAPIIVMSMPESELVEDQLDEKYLKEHYSLRPEILLAVYIDRNLWEAFLKTRR